MLAIYFRSCNDTNTWLDYNLPLIGLQQSILPLLRGFNCLNLRKFNACRSKYFVSKKHFSGLHVCFISILFLNLMLEYDQGLHKVSLEIFLEYSLSKNSITLIWQPLQRDFDPSYNLVSLFQNFTISGIIYSFQKVKITSLSNGMFI